jgi:hypothetical protein
MGIYRQKSGRILPVPRKEIMDKKLEKVVRDNLKGHLSSLTSREEYDLAITSS